jgi:site-specific recombinase XerD
MEHLWERICVSITGLSTIDIPRKAGFWRPQQMPAEGRIRISAAIADFLVHLKAIGRAETTIGCYRQDLRRLERALKDMPVCRISDTMIDRAVVRLAHPHCSGTPLSAASVNRMKSAWRSFFSWCLLSDRIPNDPSRALGLAQVDPKRTVALRLHETEAFLGTIHKSSDPLALRDEALFALYAFTGMRRGEALALRVGDYDRSGRCLRVERAKGGRSRICVVPARLARVLDRYIRSLALNQRQSASAPLFPGSPGDRGLSPRRAQVRFHHWRRLAGIRGSVTIRSFRVGFGTILHNAGLDSMLIARALGHADCRVTERYVEMDQSTLCAILDRAIAGRPA